MTTQWAILTGEYPPQMGGVSDYTRLIATGLASAGDNVCVYAPAVDGLELAEPGVCVRRVPDQFGPQSLANLDRWLGPPRRDRRILIQYVPYAYGWRGMNVPFCWWAYSRSRGGDNIELVVHEPYLTFGRFPRYWPVAAAHRVMATLLLHASTRVWVTIPKWEELLRPYAPRATDFRWLPVPSTLPYDPGRRSVSAAVTYLFGHFSSFGKPTSDLLAATLRALLPRVVGRVLLIGMRSQEFRSRFVGDEPAAAGRLTATGSIPLASIPTHLADCEMMLQPVGGGVTGRNTSVLACLQNGRSVVTTTGWLTEHFWATSGAVALSPNCDPVTLAEEAVSLSRDSARRQSIADRGRELYDQTYDLRHTVRLLRKSAPRKRRHEGEL